MALAQVKDGREHIPGEIQKAMPDVKTELSDFGSGNRASPAVILQKNCFLWPNTLSQILIIFSSLRKYNLSNSTGFM